MEPYEYYRAVRIDEQLEKIEKDIDFLKNHPLRALTLGILRPFTKGFRYGSLNIQKRIQPQRPQGKYPDSASATISCQANNIILQEIGVFSNSNVNTYKIKTTHNKYIIFVHAYYQKEAEAIFDIIENFKNFDIVVTSPFDFIFESKSLKKMEERLVRIRVPNHGRDVYPFLASLNLIDIDKYEGFIKFHTKKSQHLKDQGCWFNRNVKYLLGNAIITTEMLNAISIKSSPIILGESTLSMLDHYETNKYWMNELISDIENIEIYRFIPGTMFLGNSSFLKLVKSAHIENYIFENENMQLDGCIMHAIERYFGFITQYNQGICLTLDEFSVRCLYD
jgi:hypothetical protein